MSKFQLVVVVCIIGFVLVALLVLSGVIPGFKQTNISKNVVNLTVWGSLDYSEINKIIQTVNAVNTKSFVLKYFQINGETYESELINALAGGEGPDIWIMDAEWVLRHQDKVYVLPYKSFNERAFRDYFIDGADVFMGAEGTLAVPFLADPLILFWNKDIFVKNGLSAAPKTWDNFVEYSAILTEKDNFNNIALSGVAMGEFDNIKNAKDIISSLILQSGAGMVSRSGDSYNVSFRNSRGEDVLQNSLVFFTGFSNPTKISYSWNRSLANSFDSFISGKLAMYFGHASELGDIREKNPHLNFDVFSVPQLKNSSFSATAGRVYALAISRKAADIQEAVNAVFQVAGVESMKHLGDFSFFSPAVKEVLAEGHLNQFLSVFYKASIQIRSWLEPDGDFVDGVFGDIVDSVVTGKKTAREASSYAENLITSKVRSLTK